MFLGNGEGGFALSQRGMPYPFESGVAAQIGDVNGDGIPDLLLASSGSIGVALGMRGHFILRSC